jgi:hypothetical protein
MFAASLADVHQLLIFFAMVLMSLEPALFSL